MLFERSYKYINDYPDRLYFSAHTLKIPINEYLNSLPDNIEKINLINRNLTELPDLTRFKNLKELYCSKNKLTFLPKIDTLEILDCSINQLNTIPILDNLKVLQCYHNNLVTIPLLNNLFHLDCGYNNINYLPKLKNLEILLCYNNQLEYLPILNKLEKLDCSHNQLKVIPQLNNLFYIDCSNNNIIEMKPLPNLEHMCHHVTETFVVSNMSYLYNNPIHDMFSTEINYTNGFGCLSSDEFDKFKNKLIIFNKFKFLYYCLKYKNIFKNLLWNKVRRPKIENYYHPHNLIIFLENNNYDLDNLHNW